MNLWPLEHFLARFVITIRFSSNQNTREDQILFLIKILEREKSNCDDKSGQKVFKKIHTLVNVKTIRKIAQIFVAFSKKLNFKGDTSSNFSMDIVTLTLF